MTNDLTELFDKYSLRARVYPGLLTSLPIVVSVLLVWPDSGLNVLWPVVAAAGVMFLMANFVRSRGKKLEARLILEWDGLPTTRMLRHREATNATQFERRRRGLERVFGQSLPTPQQEGADPASADGQYGAATRVMIARVRDNPKDYPRVHEENIHYGFRRNLLALKPIALIILAAVTVADGIAIYIQLQATSLVAVGINILAGATWLGVVNKEWVHEAAETYADRLFETLEQDGLTVT